MPADAINYGILARELNATLSGGRIEKILMSDRSTLMLCIRGRGVTENLLVTAATSPRCFLAKKRIAATDVPLSFCLHLRRHIGGGVVDGVEALPFERILLFRITARGDLGEEVKRVMIVEIMGKYSNIVLTDGDLKITDALKHISLGEGRAILPGLTYAVPQDETRFDPTDEAGTAALEATVEPSALPSVMVKRLRGLSAKTASEIVAVAAKERCGLAKAARLLLARTPEPVVVMRGGKPVDFAFCPYSVETDEVVRVPSLSEAMDAYYGATAAADEKTAGENAVRRALNAALEKQRKKLGAFTLERENASNYEHERILGELLTANLYRIKPGDKFVEVENWYEGGNVRIELTENTPQEDAQKHFRRYQKKKRTVAATEERIAETSAAIDYLESVEASLSLATTTDDVAELREELEEAGVMGRQNAKKKRTESAPRLYRVGEFDVLVGKSNLQNDRITKEARGEDLWLHTQGFHGSHVVVKARGKEVPQSVIRRAAEIAAFFSKARQSDNVPVDYTKAKNVHKQRGAAPGKVDYFGAKTVYVSPTPPEDGTH